MPLGGPHVFAHPIDSAGAWSIGAIYRGQLERFHHADDSFGDLCQRRSATGVDFTGDSRPVGGFVSNLRGLFAVFGAIRNRRHARELHSQRELAEHRRDLCASGFLRSFLETQLKTFGQQSEWSRAEMSAKLDRLESELRQSIEQCQNSLAASMAELDDRLEHGAGESRPRKLT